MKMLSIVLLFVGLAAQAQDNDVWHLTTSECATMHIEFDEYERMQEDGNRHVQFRLYSYTTGVTEYVGDETSTGTVFPVDENPVDLPMCDLVGMWSIQLRYAFPDPENPLVLLSWANWQEVYAVEMHEGDQMPDPIVRPNPPSLFAVDGVLAKDPSGYSYGVQITRGR